MSDLKVLNNRLDYVERQRMDAVDRAKELEQQRDTARTEANYFRQECRVLAGRGNASQAIAETLARRVEAHRRDLIPGDRIAAAALLECEAVLEVVTSIIGGPQ